jgi:hypothetical protein
MLVGQVETANIDALPIYSVATRQLVKLATGLAKDKAITPKTVLLAILQVARSKAFEILKSTGELDRLINWLSE